MSWFWSSQSLFNVHYLTLWSVNPNVIDPSHKAGQLLNAQSTTSAFILVFAYQNDEQSNVLESM